MYTALMQDPGLGLWNSSQKNPSGHISALGSHNQEKNLALGLMKKVPKSIRLLQY